MKKNFSFLFLLLPTLTFANNDATVIVLRGKAVTDAGKPLQLKDTVPPGTTVKTESRSFVKLLFKDNTQMSIGPETTMKLEPVNAGEPSLVNLVGGQIRAKVTKDLLQNPEQGPTKEKMLIKTKTAAMGIRGTDFNVSFNAQNSMTALVTFEGSVAMARIEANQSPSAALQQSEGVQMVGPGLYSGADPTMPNVTIPVKISPAQLESLKSNDSFQGMTGDAAKPKEDGAGSPIPPGVDPKNFSSGADQALAQNAGADSSTAATTETRAANAPPPEGFFDKSANTYAPRAGGFIDLGTGRYIPPPPGSSFDPNTGVYVPPKVMGQFDPNTGMYVPPKGVTLDAVKGFVVEAASRSGQPAPSPGAPLPPAAAMMQKQIEFMNVATKPEMAGKEVTLAMAPVAGMERVPMMTPPPPPPPPTNFNNLPPPPREPIDNPFCPTCISDNVNQPPPPNTSVRFQITVQ